jgi:tyrosinase
MEPGERKAYTDAVLCLQHKPSQLDPAVYPGAKTRYDDFVAVHINLTLGIHLDALFLSWHRNYVFLYQQALEEECGYQGVAPYWHWPKWANKLNESPLFDGSEYSLSGDGAYNASLGPYIIGPNATLPRGSGGGCVTSGPFKNHIANLGPFDFSLVFTANGVLPSWAFDYNPRCFSRDLNTYVAETYTNQSDVDALLDTQTIEDFQDVLSGVAGTLNLGPHGGGHLTMGAQGFDFFASPNDPAFFLHHGQIDRLWWKWQMEDPVSRIYGNNSLFGTSTILNIPPSPNSTLTDYEQFVILDEPRQIKELMSIHAGPFCYTYQDPSP